jgi:HD-GYP domain-containing protein (c-di-GMP phosphodiesterase class II)
VDRLDAFYAGLVHDIGLLGEAGNPDRWRNCDEQANRPLIRSHPIVGAEMIAETPELFTIAPMVLDHHECINGHGYPRGKAGDEIAVPAQILRFADTCDVVLREQGSPELISFLHAARGRTTSQVSSTVADAGVEVLGEPGFYAQLLAAEDVEFLVQSTLHRLAPDDFVTTEAELTGLLELFANLADAYPADKTGHSRRVANLAVLVAMAMGLDSDETSRIKWAGLVHDVGVVTVPKDVLDKPGHLTAGEMATVRGHAAATETFITPVRGLEEVAAIAGAHNEAFDGSGYPRGLSGRGIPLGARILAACDTFDALTSHRPYREARDTTLSIDILVKGSGSLFDPDVVEAAVPALLIARPAEEPIEAGV